ncbi:MAG TPA: DUF362 domain-containing protein [Thermoguttaceae bacterium]|nr:DUF362 domain-containing protein [Thermoguttaceae bacterium]
MSSEITRREALLRGVGAAGVLATGLHRGAAAQQPDAAAEPPDKSDQAPSSPVAIRRCPSFEPEIFRQTLDAALDLIGGIGEMVRNKTVTIKINLTGMSWDDLYGMPAYETYQTHPNTLAALCAALNDAGAKRIVVVENLYWDVPIEKSLVDAGWDLKMIDSAGGHKVTYEDTRNKGSFPGYSRFQVPWGGYIFPAFDLNQRFEKTDVFVSLSKLKQHACAGVTMTIKNLFGITPCSLYGNQAPSENPLSHRTSIFHGGKKQVPAGVPAELDHGQPALSTVRVPRIAADVYGARPVDLTIVDGIRTIRGGEGHWNRDIGLKEPKLLLAGKNGVCTDAIGTAVMGFDPQAPHGTHPFQGDNHLRLLAAQGMGTIDSDRIEVVGVPLDEAVHPFDPPPPRS